MRNRYKLHFKNPDIIRFDMQHEAWLFDKKWRQPLLDTIDKCMGIGDGANATVMCTLAEKGENNSN